MRTTTATVILFLSSLWATARADTLSTHANQTKVITEIAPKVWQLGVDSTLLLNYARVDGEGSYQSSGVASLVIRYFPRRNLGVSVRPALMFRRSDASRDLGGLGTIWINGFARLGDGRFFSPGIGVGFAGAQRTVKITDTELMKSTVLAGVVAVELPITLFVNRRWSLTAGPEFRVLLGGDHETGGDTAGFVAIDGGFKVGVQTSF